MTTQENPAARKAALNPEGHSKPIGRYSPGIAVGVPATARLVFISGQVATDDKGAVLAPGDAGRQTEILFERLGQVLSSAGGQVSDLVNLVIYVTDVKRDLSAISAARNRALGDPPPASTLIEVSRLAELGCLVEISGIALVAGGG